MKLSHSKLNTILTCPMSYYLNYKQGISLKVEKAALEIGSAVHWGIEHNTEDLTEYLNEIGSYALSNYSYDKELTLAESMIHGYLKHKDELFEKLLTDYDGKTKLELFDEIHELSLTEKLKSFKYKLPHEFIGIIDLLLLTNKGFIVVDYKTSSQTPDWDKYTDQLYRYIYLLSQEFPDTPVYKIAIINLKKVGLKQKQTENRESYLNRLKTEYEINDNELIAYHEFSQKDIDTDNLNIYIDNLSKMCDFAQMIDEKELWFINFNNAVSVYGKSPYYDIFYNKKDCEYLYKIKDKIFDDNLNEIVEYRDCTKLDLEAIYDPHNIINHYSQFLTIIDELGNKEISKEDLFKFIKSKYKTSDKLLEKYWQNYKMEETSDE